MLIAQTLAPTGSEHATAAGFALWSTNQYTRRSSLIPRDIIKWSILRFADTNFQIARYWNLEFLTSFSSVGCSICRLSYSLICVRLFGILISNILGRQSRFLLAIKRARRRCTVPLVGAGADTQTRGVGGMLAPAPRPPNLRSASRYAVMRWTYFSVHGKQNQ